MVTLKKDILNYIISSIIQIVDYYSIYLNYEIIKIKRYSNVDI